jgi:peptidoglycan hydrolase CwlO-like protein
MLEIIKTILPYISPTALPLVVVILGGLFIYKKIGNDRAKTKEIRDTDSQKIHDDILKLQFKVTEIDGRTVKHEQVIEDLREQINLLNTNVVRLSVVIEQLAERLEKQ